MGRWSAFLDVVASVADELGNTVAVCRRSYIHPAVESWFLEAGEVPRGRGALRRHRPYERELIALLSSGPAADPDALGQDWSTSEPWIEPRQAQQMEFSVQPSRGQAYCWAWRGSIHGSEVDQS